MSLLVAAVARGDKQAFATLFHHFAPRVAAYLIRSGSSPAEAEELAQEAMIIVWRKADGFVPERAAVSTWIFTIARHLRIDRVRHDKSDQRLLDIADFDFADPAPVMEERLDASRREARVREALRDLPSEQLRLLQLSYYAEMPHAEIARDLRMPLGTVKSRIRQAVHALRRALGDPT